MVGDLRPCLSGGMVQTFVTEPERLLGDVDLLIVSRRAMVSPVEVLLRNGDALIGERIASGVDLYDEIHEGRYVVMNAPGFQHQNVVANVVGLLRSVGLSAVGGVNVGHDLDYRIPDVAAWASSPLGGDFFTGDSAPLIVVEVLSPSNSRGEMASREAHYERHGVGTYVEMDLGGEVVYSTGDETLVGQLRNQT